MKIQGFFTALTRVNAFLIFISLHQLLQLSFSLPFDYEAITDNSPCFISGSCFSALLFPFFSLNN